MVCDVGGGPAAVAGLEWHGGEALLRSVAVARALRSHGLGRAVVKAAIARTRDRGTDELFLLTTTAGPYFAELGFEAVERQSLPPALSASAELQGACPATATAMRLKLV
ncbi:MAG: GNAT family N-acetyltransferase [Bacillota bacterium]|nr:GNAT family N-acetyltransferase [Bacillota bacterium]